MASRLLATKSKTTNEHKLNRTISLPSVFGILKRNADGYLTCVLVHSLLLILLCNLKRNRSDVDVFSSNNIFPQSFPSYQHLSFTRRNVADATLTQQVALPYTMNSESESLATGCARSKFCMWLSSCSSCVFVNEFCGPLFFNIDS